MDRFPPPPPEALGPSPGWTEIDLSAGLAQGVGRQFISGDPEGRRLRIRYYSRPEELGIVGRVWFGPDAEGPPAHAHGGAMAAVLDEAMGLCCIEAGEGGVAARLVVDLRDMLPLGTVAAVEAVIEQIDGRKVSTRARLVGPSGQVHAEAQGLFIRLSAERVRALTSAPRWLVSKWVAGHRARGRAGSVFRDPRDIAHIPQRSREAEAAEIVREGP